MTWWVDISKAFENKQLELWGWRVRDKGWIGILQKGKTEIKEADDISGRSGLRWELLLRDSCTGAVGDAGVPPDGLHRSHHPGRKSTKMGKK